MSYLELLFADWTDIIFAMASVSSFITLVRSHAFVATVSPCHISLCTIWKFQQTALGTKLSIRNSAFMTNIELADQASPSSSSAFAWFVASVTWKSSSHISCCINSPLEFVAYFASVKLRRSAAKAHIILARNTIPSAQSAHLRFLAKITRVFPSHIIGWIHRPH